MVISTKKIFRAVVILAMILPFFLAYGVKVSAFSIEDERTLGKKFMDLIKKEVEFIEDPQITPYIRGIGEHVVAQTGYQPFNCKFYVIKSPELNAFAAPAGQVFITSGLIGMLDNEGELASILGHEMGHVTARHIAKRIEQSKVLNWVTLAGAIAGMLLGRGSEAGAALATSSMAAGESLTLKYTRDNEREADQLGLKFLTKAGYSGRDMIGALKKLRKYSLISPQIPAYLSTHPALDDRIIDLEQAILFVPSTETTTKNQDFRRVKVLVIAEYLDPETSISKLKSALRSNPNDFLSHYGLGLAYKRMNRIDTALEEFKKASSLKPDASYILREMGICYLYKGNFDLATTSLEKATTLDPGDDNAHYYLARSYQESGKKDISLRIYKQLVARGFDLPDVHYNLGVIYGENGNWGPAHYHLGLFFKKKGERANALYHLREALKLYQGDMIKQDEINKEIRELERGIS